MDIISFLSVKYDQRTKEQISVFRKYAQAYGGECCDQWYQMQR